eukprot:TRINITY_DN6075_c0_g1_i1.p1 TRINITY_DN6075_c0_g1~~TRINITY_DN6075_c0_g1_i1.p1  ORF type:complete len:742 (+),score=117.79 TRINITY_DN6075_c0_g1_i1:231-2228(+)
MPHSHDHHSLHHSLSHPDDDVYNTPYKASREYGDEQYKLVDERSHQYKIDVHHPDEDQGHDSHVLHHTHTLGHPHHHGHHEHDHHQHHTHISHHEHDHEHGHPHTHDHTHQDDPNTPPHHMHPYGGPPDTPIDHTMPPMHHYGQPMSHSLGVPFSGGPPTYTPPYHMIGHQTPIIPSMSMPQQYQMGSPSHPQSMDSASHGAMIPVNSPQIMQMNFISPPNTEARPEDSAPDSPNMGAVSSNSNVRKNRWRPTPRQKAALEQLWQENQYPDRVTKQKLANDLDQTTEQISRWFKHRRENLAQKGEFAYKAKAAMKFTNEQITALEEVFSNNPYPSRDDIKSLGERLGVSVQRVKNWFKARRCRLAQKGEFEFKPRSSPTPSVGAGIMEKRRKRDIPLGLLDHSAPGGVGLNLAMNMGGYSLGLGMLPGMSMLGPGMGMMSPELMKRRPEEENEGAVGDESLHLDHNAYYHPHIHPHNHHDMSQQMGPLPIHHVQDMHALGGMSHTHPHDIPDMHSMGEHQLGPEHIHHHPHMTHEPHELHHPPHHPDMHSMHHYSHPHHHHHHHMHAQHDTVSDTHTPPPGEDDVHGNHLPPPEPLHTMSGHSLQEYESQHGPPHGVYHHMPPPHMMHPMHSHLHQDPSHLGHSHLTEPLHRNHTDTLPPIMDHA